MCTQSAVSSSQTGHVYPFPVPQGGIHCFAGNDSGLYEEAGICDRRCSGNPAQYCGSSCTNSLYKTALASGGPWIASFLASFVVVVRSLPAFYGPGQQGSHMMA
jgi:hypothetical protein